jgi:hypothetical protein
MNEKTIQVNVRMPEEMVQKLESAAQKYKRRSINQVSLEIIDYYLEFWIQAEEVKQGFISQQRELFSRKINAGKDDL